MKLLHSNKIEVVDPQNKEQNCYQKMRIVLANVEAHRCNMPVLHISWDRKSPTLSVQDARMTTQPIHNEAEINICFPPSF